MSLFRSIVFTAVLVGSIVGTAVTTVQFFGTSRLIAQAEVYEKAGETRQPADVATIAPLGHDHAAMADRDHEEAGWEPADGLERTAFTLAANILTAIGYALALTGLISMRGGAPGWREGLMWGLAGFACVMIAPMLGLPPELPGTPSAPLADRQAWWIATVAATACGLALIAFHRKPWTAVAAIALIAAPHVIGAPAAPEGQHALAPEALEHQFIAAAAMTSLVFWALLGSLSGTFFRRFEA
ncbi:CbtA family protein (plasmid) [Rhizobium ruizarguesonis]|nr:CbtA family protein [Rhizobium ruizarguesonis]